MTTVSAAENRIKKLATISEILCYLATLFILVVAIFPLYQVFIDSPFKDNIFIERVVPKSLELNPIAYGRELAALFIFIPALIAVSVLVQTKRLFAGYRRGEIFTIKAASQIKAIGWTLFLVPPANFLGKVIAAAALTSYESLITLKFITLMSWGNFIAIIVGLLLMVFGRTLLDAISQTKENRSFI